MGLKDKLLAQRERTYRTVTHPLLGDVLLRSLTEWERSCFESSCIGGDRGRKKDRDAWMLTTRAKLLMFTACELNGDGQPKPVFTYVLDKTSGKLSFDSEELKQMLDVNAAVLAPLGSAAMEHVGFTESDLADLLKNSEATTAGE